MDNYLLLPSIRKDYAENGTLSSSLRHSMISHKYTNIPILQPKFSIFTKKNHQPYTYITRAIEIFSSHPPSISKKYSFKYSRLTDPSGPYNSKPKNSYLKPISIQSTQHKILVNKVSLSVDQSKLAGNNNPRRTKRHGYNLKGDRRTVLSKISNYNISLGMSDSESNYSEDIYYLDTKLDDLAK